MTDGRRFPRKKTVKPQDLYTPTPPIIIPKNLGMTKDGTFTTW